MTHASDGDDAWGWDDFYRGDDVEIPHWSGQPNPSLVAEASTLRPGRALDVGCGEGADAIWLASHGWRVTAIDPSRVALDRAEAAARAAEVDVTWIRAGLLDLRTGSGPYDLVSAHYPVLPREDDDEAIAALLRAVAWGGTLLFVHHELDPTLAPEHGFDPSAHVTPDALATVLDAHWEVEAFEPRDRIRHQDPEGTGPRDVVLRARRR